MAIADYIPVLLRPALLLTTAVYHCIMTLLQNPTLIFNLSTLQEKSFARLWSQNGEAMSVEMPGPTFALLKTVSGTVLDVGPGSGEQLPRFDPSIVTIMYGAEPSINLHAGLLKNAEKAGFGGKYKALHCGGEPESLIPALAKAGALAESKGQGIFDVVVCVRVLCGVPRPEETIEGLYKLLKPGGRMIVCEHVINPWQESGSVLARVMQVVYTVLGWPFFMGNCHVDRDTKKYLQEAAGKDGWASVKLEYVEPKTAIPFVVGELVKRS
ncbi:hypothetical protein K432DRAFT_377384 [Lepidopterella palustris CBS 459.81]|uniref:S-adenosyl-L-methionine-dependent methyltransferase n=1 Tax=Lepidopterella palustris CBS 459.81 TaxID=1314670 RepID=A0A8E2EKZ9_9PEZI|nr:hypothetical protein K432DRAFT_377384 [Lepidopterella palustris CBS 459.81]